MNCDLIQRVRSASVTGQVVGKTGPGLLILIGLVNGGPVTIWDGPPTISIDGAAPQTLSCPIN